MIWAVYLNLARYVHAGIPERANTMKRIAIGMTLIAGALALTGCAGGGDTVNPGNGTLTVEIIGQGTFPTPVTNATRNSAGLFVITGTYDNGVTASVVIPKGAGNSLSFGKQGQTNQAYASFTNSYGTFDTGRDPVPNGTGNYSVNGDHVVGNCDIRVFRASDGQYYDMKFSWDVKFQDIQ